MQPMSVLLWGVWRCCVCHLWLDRGLNKMVPMLSVVLCFSFNVLNKEIYTKLYTISNLTTMQERTRIFHCIFWSPFLLLQKPHVVITTEAKFSHMKIIFASSVKMRSYHFHKGSSAIAYLFLCVLTFFYRGYCFFTFIWCILKVCPSCSTTRETKSLSDQWIL